MEYAIMFAGFVVGVFLYLGLSEIAGAIRNRSIDVNVKLPPIKIMADDEAPK